MKLSVSYARQNQVRKFQAQNKILIGTNFCNCWILSNFVCRIPSEESAGALEMSKEAAQFINNEQLVMQKLSIKMGAKMVECQPGRVFG